MVIHKHVGARVGLMGNPSDGFGGKTLASLIENYSASVTAWESPQIEIVPHPRYDPFSFRSLQDLADTASLDGYYGGLRLIYATCRRFHEYCRDRGITLPSRNFTLEYDSTIPRQVGLAGSSAITVATLDALLELFEIGEDDMPVPLRPTFALEIETHELNIQAGLQDRVVQVYGGLVYMDFDPDLMARHGHGYYERLDLDLLPPLYLAHSNEPSDSGRMHSIVAAKFHEGDPEVQAGMREFASYTDEAYEALHQRDYARFGQLIDANFDLRRKLYGDAWLGARNLHMVELARSLGLPAHFPGSGGAVVGFYEDDAQFSRARRAFQDSGFNFERAFPVESASGGHAQETLEWHRLHRLALAR